MRAGTVLSVTAHMVPDVNLLVAAMHRLTWLKGQEPGTSFSDSAYSSHDPSISDLAAALEDGSCQLAETTLDGVRRILLRAGYPVAVVMSYADWLRRTTDAHGGYHVAISAQTASGRRSGTPLPSGRVVAAAIVALFGLCFLFVWLAR